MRIRNMVGGRIGDPQKPGPFGGTSIPGTTGSRSRDGGYTYHHHATVNISREPNLPADCEGSRSFGADGAPGADQPGRFALSSSSHTAAEASLGARQSPRGLSAPAVETFGPLGIALRLN